MAKKNDKDGDLAGALAPDENKVQTAPVEQEAQTGREAQESDSAPGMVNIEQSALTAIMDRITTLEAQASPDAGSIRIDDGKIHLSREIQEEGLATVYSETVFFGLHPKPLIMLQSENRKINAITQTQDVTKGVLFKLNKWAGFGADLDWSGRKKLKLSMGDLSRNTGITITEEDIEVYRLVGIDTREGRMSLEKAIAMVKRSTLFRTGPNQCIYTAAVFQEMCRAGYQGMWGAAESLAKVRRLQAQSSQGEIRSGLAPAM